MKTRLCIAYAVFCSLAVTDASSQQFADPTRDQLQGYWKTDGYGWVFDISKQHVRVFDTASDICVFNAKLDAKPMTLARRHNAQISSDGDALSFTLSDNVHPIVATRLAELPEECAANSQGVTTTFDAFTTFLDKHYKLFDLHGVDWTTTVENARLSLEDDMSDSDLFALFSSMIKNIEDARVTLRGNVDDSYQFFVSRDYELRDAIDLAIMEDTLPSDFEFSTTHWETNVLATVLASQGKSVANDLIRYGMLTDDTGYIAIRNLYGFAGHGIEGAHHDARPLNKALDQVFSDLAGASAIILDLSANTGGTDNAAAIIASRFTDQEFRAYSKQTLDADNSARTNVKIPASDASRFTGPVYVMTSELTRGSAEVLTMSLKALPNVLHVGSSTNGAFGGVLEKRLPNGWILGLSNEMYFDHKGITWDIKGLEPDYALEVFPVEKITTGHPEAVTNVVKMIADRSLSNQ